MKRLMNFLRGIITLTAVGPFPERLVNLCAQEGVDFWGLDWLDEHTIRLTIRRGSLSLLKQLAQRVGCELQEEGRRGLPDFLLRFRTRYAFLVGLVLSLCAVAFLSRFVLTIEVTGNEQVPTAVILSQLRQLGVRPGVYGPGIDRKQVAQEALLKLEDLAWMGINLHGTRLEVIVREAIKSPERIDEQGYYDVVAEADGMITHVEAELGDAVVKEGDIVAAGDILISGTVTMEPPEYSGMPNRYYQVHARGRVWARTWRTMTAEIPLTAEKKTYTGAEKSRWSLEVLGRRIKIGEIFGNSSISWSFYDKITSVCQTPLPWTETLPIVCRREIFREYETQTVDIDLDAAQTLLEQQLSKQLEQVVGEDGEINTVQFSARVNDGLLQVTLLAECKEEIGTELPGATPLPESPNSEGAETPSS